MIKQIILSRDRACQLYLLLESIQKYTHNLFETDVIYKATTKKHEEGYHQLIQEHMHNIDINFYREGPFIENKSGQYWGIMSSLHKSKRRYICFCTDDSVIYRPFKYNNFYGLQTYLPQNEHEIFSFRLGQNTLEMNRDVDPVQPPLTDFDRVNDDIITWNALNYKEHDDFGYSMAYCHHVYKKEHMLKMLQKSNWNNSNELEVHLCKYRSNTHIMRSFKQSVSVDIPINNLSGWTRFGKFYSISVDKLNHDFLEGYKINLEHIESQKITGTHQEIPFEFVRRSYD